MTQRSTKGASKQRRDAINDRVAQIRELLPVSEAARSRLSQLQVMALAKSYIAKSNLFSTINQAGVFSDDRETTWSDHFDFLQAVPGFLLVFRLDGKIIYISDNVCDYLGNSAVDIITQAETVYDLADERDHAVIREALSPGSSPDSGLLHPSSSSSSRRQLDNIVSFVCRMNTAARNVRYASPPIKTGFERFRTMQVNGRRLTSSDMTSLRGYPSASGPMTWLTSSESAADCVFVGVCTPSLCAADVLSTSLLDGGAVAWDTSVFRSQHHIDMKFISVDANGKYLLGYDRATVYGKSWYEMIHPDDIEEARFKHIDLIQSVELSAWRSLCVRVQSGGGHVIWLHVIMRMCDVNSGDVTERRIVCINQVVDENEARVIRANAAHDDSMASPASSTQDVLDWMFYTWPSAPGGKRKAAASDDWAAVCSPAKAARLTDGMFDEAYLMSMPSPPLSDDTKLAWPMTSSYPSISVKEESMGIPESFLTPTGSPCSDVTSSPAPVNHPVLLSDHHELNADLGVDELSFFDQAIRHRRQDVKPRFLIGEGKLPVLDLPTVTSYFDCLEQSRPLSQTAPVIGQHGGQPPVSVQYSRALKGCVAGLQQPQDDMSTINEDLLQDLLSTANTFLSCVTAPLDSYNPDLLFAHC